MPVTAAGTGTRLWTPADGGLPSVIAGWWDPSDGSRVAQSAGSVDSVYDGAGLGRHVSNTGTNRPTLSTINGLTALSLASASTQYLANTSLTTEGGNTGTWFAVFNTSTIAGNARLVSCSPAGSNDFNATNAIAAILQDNVGNGISNFYANAQRAAITSSISTGVSYVTALQRDGDTARAWLSSTMTTSTVTGLGTSNFAITRVFLGVNNGSDGPYNGKLGEVLWCRAALSEEWVRFVMRYLSGKWRIPLATGGACSPPLVFA